MAWDSAAQLVRNLDEAKDFGVDEVDVSDAYWEASRLRLSSAYSTTQQGVEFLLKGRIAEVSPFLLIMGAPSDWPSPYKSDPPKFSQFRTLDAQDLPRVHDTVSDKTLPDKFIQKYLTLRETRNTIMHSVNKSLTFPVVDLLNSILFVHSEFFPGERWTSVRLGQLEKSPDVELWGYDFLRNQICWEISVIIKSLPPAEVMKYFGIDKKQRFYSCPTCYSEADNSAGFEQRIAVLRPKGPEAVHLYCPICDSLQDILREDCESCEGNVLDVEGTCMTCA